jgi:hypothetical protein
MTESAIERRLQLRLFCGIMLIFLAVWKGDGGYLDLRQYLDNAEGMWLKGDLSIPGQPGNYYIHPLGIAFLSGPFVIAGAIVEKISAGAVSERSIAALSVPVFSALACLLLYKIGRELQLSPLVSVWGAVMLGVATPVLSFSRLFFAEGGIAFSVCLSGWAFLRARHAGEKASLKWALLAGVGLAGITACHFNNLFVSCWLWLGMAGTFAFNRTLGLRIRIKQIVALSVIPAVAGAALFYMNARRFGSPLATGYSSLLAEFQHPISMLNIPLNFQHLLTWLVRVPWAIPALLLLTKLWPRERGWALALGAAAITQVFFFQMYIGLQFFPIRYVQTAVILLSVGLLLLGNELWRRWRTRGLAYGALLLLLWNAGHFIRSTDTPSSQAFWVSPDGGGVNAFVWYMGPQVSRTTFGSPMGPLQWAVLLGLLGAGTAVLVLSVQTAKKISDESSPSDQQAASSGV